jgi:hypothetical protein
MAGRIRFDKVVNERGTCQITTTLTSETGAALPGSVLDTCELTLYDEASGTILNDKSGADIKGNVDGAGLLTLILSDLDHAVLNPLRQIERHIALLEWTYASAAKAGRQEVEIDVRNLGKV